MIYDPTTPEGRSALREICALPRSHLGADDLLIHAARDALPKALEEIERLTEHLRIADAAYDEVVTQTNRERWERLQKEPNTCTENSGQVYKAG